MRVHALTQEALRLLLVFATGGLLASHAGAQVRNESLIQTPAIGEGLCVHNLFQSNMVVQRDRPMRVWGWAEPGESVTVSFGSQQDSTVARDDRTWSVTLPAPSVSRVPSHLVITGKDQTVTLENVLVGDVWVLGGQSNMEHPLARIENGGLEIASAHYPEMRILTVPAQAGPTPEPSFPRLEEWSGWFNQHFRKGHWDVCAPDAVRELSAIGFVFARRVHTGSRVPIGVIDASRGGTTVETWTPISVLAQLDAAPVRRLLTEWDDKVAAWDSEQDLANRVKQHEEYVRRMTEQGSEIPADRVMPTDLRPGPAMDHNRPGSCYAGMIAPIAGFSVKGAIFHQGYNNCFNLTEGARLYREVFPEMIKAWRSAFNDPQMPFCILSLCTEGAVQTRDNFTESMFNAGPYIREAQYQTFLDLVEAGDEHIGFVSTYDLRRRWYHPQLKIPAGERAARWALATQYGLQRDVQWKPPMLTEMTVEDGQIVLRMDGQVGGVDDGSPIVGFAIAGADRKFHPADAEHLIVGEDNRGRPKKDQSTLVLTSPMVPEPLHYRYAWARSPMGNLQGRHMSDIPFATQRSDDWPLEDVPLGVLGDEPLAEINRAQRRQVQEALRREDIRRRTMEAEAFLREHRSADGQSK